VMLALVALAFFLLVAHGLRAPPAAALLVLALLPMTRILVHVADHPFHNQIWGTFAMPLATLFGVLYLRRPELRTGVLLIGFLALGAFAYPLMLPFPLVSLALGGVVIWRERRAAGEPLRWFSALRLPRGRRSLVRWVPLGILALPVLLVLVKGVIEKTGGAAGVILPWNSLEGWRALVHYLPFGRFFGVPEPALVAVPALLLIFAAAVWGARRSARDLGPPLVVTSVAALLFALDFRLRNFGEFFYFKDMGFVGPLIVTLAIVGVADLALQGSRRWRTAGVAALAVFAVSAVAGARDEIGSTYDFLTPDTKQLSGWTKQLPPGRSVRFDLPQDGTQLWAIQLMANRPVSTTNPISSTTFPHPPLSRTADYILTKARAHRPVDAAGPPLLHNRIYKLYRMKPGVPGPDRSSRRTLQEFSSVFDAGG
jgi:hypothetical protein